MFEDHKGVPIKIGDYVRYFDNPEDDPRKVVGYYFRETTTDAMNDYGVIYSFDRPGGYPSWDRANNLVVVNMPGTNHPSYSLLTSAENMVLSNMRALEDMASNALELGENRAECLRNLLLACAAVEKQIKLQLAERILNAS